MGNFKFLIQFLHIYISESFKHVLVSVVLRKLSVNFITFPAITIRVIEVEEKSNYKILRAFNLLLIYLVLILRWLERCHPHQYSALNTKGTSVFIPPISVES